MKYLLISNKGLLDITLLKLIGASTKTNDSTKIGQFGTGLKYAISYMLRTKNKFRMFIGDQEVKFSLKTVTAKKQEFEEIFCNGKSMSITTHYGYQWQGWEAIREIWCNAIDEKEAIRKVLEDKVTPKGKKGYTRFYIEVTEDIEDVITNWGHYFIEREATYSDDLIAIYTKKNPKLKIYKNKVLVDPNPYYKSLFNYDFKNCELNELRQYQGYVNSDIGEAILNSNQEVVGLYLNALNDPNVTGIIEKGNITFDYAKYDKKKIKQIFQGYLFLHPDSEKGTSNRSVKVPLKLYTILKECGLPCENIRTSYGGGYYGGGHSRGYEQKAISYKIVEDDKLAKRVTKIMKELDIIVPFKTAVHVKEKFEIISNKEEVILNSDLNVLGDADLQAVIMIGMLDRQESNMYNVLKRLIKVTMRLKNFRKILLGK